MPGAGPRPVQLSTEPLSEPANAIVLAGSKSKGGRPLPKAVTVLSDAQIAKSSS